MSGVEGTREEPLSVTTLANGITREVSAYPIFWVVGDLRDLKRYGDRFFGSLADGASAVTVTIPPTVTRACPFDIEDGLEVVVQGRLRFERDRGQLRLEVAVIEPRDIGALQLAFEQLRRRLEAEGLFAEERKRAIPRFATRFGVVTSARGAVIHDILDTLSDRWPGHDLVLWPVSVQGEDAPERIARAIRRFAEAYPDREVLLVGRGGGSLEDLAAFNTEVVVRAIAASAIPVISCVGHETDVTLADFAADRRAATPTQAAQIATPVRRDDVEIRLREASSRVAAALLGRARTLEQRVTRVTASPVLAAPDLAFDSLRQRLEGALERIPHVIRRRVAEARTRWEHLGAQVHLVSPLATLERGFAVVRRHGTDEVVRDAGQIAEGDRVHVRLHRGSIDADVVHREVP